jgi:putative phosphoribosyl transferase
MIYFKNRAEAGRLLAERLSNHRGKPVVVMALDEGSALVGEQIAMELEAKLILYKVRPIYLPNESEPTAALDMTGRIKYNDLLSIGQIEEIIAEYRNYIEEQRIRKFHEMNVLLGKEGVIDKNMLRHHQVVIVADGMASGFGVNMAAEFLRTIAIESLIAAVPIASRDASDQVHHLADEQQILGIIDNYLNTDHYYDDNIIPNTEDTMQMMSQIQYGWHHAPETSTKKQRQILR